MQKGPIGIFDSGVGGLTVLKEVRKLLPNQDFIYFGDTKRVPYGNRSKEEIIEFSLEIVEFLKSKNVKALIIACNTIDSIASNYIRENVDIPVLGVIDSGVEMAIKYSVNKKIGLIATKGTIDSNIYKEKINRIETVELFTNPIPEFVEIVESGNKVELDKVIEEKLSFAKIENIDSLILGCTHFPVLSDDIKKYLGENIKLINPAIELSRKAFDIFKTVGNTQKSKVEYYVTGDIIKFNEVGRNILGKRLENVSQVSL